MRTLAVLPVKRFDRAKQRLSATLGEADRIALAEAMLRDVLLALARTAGLDGTLVVTEEPRAAALAGFFGAQVVGDEHDEGHNAAARRGVARARELGGERALLVPGDCPALDPDELAGMLGEDGPGVVVVPDRHGTGTNALLLAPPDAIEPAFGPGSCERHVALARAAGTPVQVRRLESLAFDVDTGADLAALRGELERRGASRLATLEALASPAR